MLPDIDAELLTKYEIIQCFSLRKKSVTKTFSDNVIAIHPSLLEWSNKNECSRNCLPFFEHLFYPKTG